MDASVIAVLKILPSCSESVEMLATAASAARQAAHTAQIFQEDGEIALAAARMLRCEKLVKSIRENLDEISPMVSRGKNLLDLESTSPATKPGEWNKLSDAWWHERANGMRSMLQTVAERKSTVSRLLCRKSGEWELYDSYSDLVGEIADAVRELKQAWSRLVCYTEDWKDIAIVVFNGIGESGSLIPT